MPETDIGASREGSGRQPSQDVVTAGVLPKVMNLAYDRSCNLACPYCRTGIYNPKKDINNTGTIHSNLFSGGLPGVERLVIAGNGDVCASRYYMEFLQDFDASTFRDLRIKIQTNGLLFTREVWARISKSHEAIDWISVSVDAATEATYRINRGGEFDKLRKCLEFVGELRRQGAIKLFYINFVVQANNFREMKRFVELGEEYGCDLVDFQCIENWGTYSEAQFAASAIHEAAHPEHEEFVDQLNDPCFAKPVVSLYKLLEFVPEDVREKYDRMAAGGEMVINYHPVADAIGQRDTALGKA